MRAKVEPINWTMGLTRDGSEEVFLPESMLTRLLTEVHDGRVSFVKHDQSGDDLQMHCFRSNKMPHGLQKLHRDVIGSWGGVDRL
jgi:hypothetical protein